MLFVVYVQGGRERQVLEQLRSKGITAYCPRRISAERRRGEWIYAERIIFGGYIFVDADAISAELWHKLKSCSGVIRLLSNSALSATEDEYIRALCNKGCCIGVSRGYVSDGTLHITDGFLRQFEHRIIKYNRRGKRATADLTMYGKHYKVILTVEIDPPAPA